MRIRDADMELESVRGECGYCGERVREKDELWLPLECTTCHQFFHLRCLKGPRPTELRGDCLWLFTCALCHPHRRESCTRPYLQWVHVIHLVLYHLMVTQEGRDGFFRWNEDICGCIQKNWQTLMPQRKRTQSWHSTVAGTLSVHCPSLFQSGAKQLGESGYWTLSSVTPPDFSPAMRTSTRTIRHPLLETEGKAAGAHETSVAMEVGSSPSPSSPPHPLHSLPSHISFSSLPPLSPPLRYLLSTEPLPTLLSHLTRASVAIGYCPRASRLRRKLMIRQRQRNHGYPNFDLDRHIIHSLSTTVKYVVDKGKPYSEQVVAVTQRGVTPHPTLPKSHSHTYHTVLHHISTFPLLFPSSPTHSPSLTTFFSGRVLNLDPIPSPYTSRLLKPYIFRSREIRPPQVCPVGQDHCLSLTSEYIRA
ncbi:Cysteine-rich protein 2-binding protein, partial [Geodia barretti]